VRGVCDGRVVPCAASSASETELPGLAGVIVALRKGSDGRSQCSDGRVRGSPVMAAVELAGGAFDCVPCDRRSTVQAQSGLVWIRVWVEHHAKEEVVRVAGGALRSCAAPQRSIQGGGSQKQASPWLRDRLGVRTEELAQLLVLRHGQGDLTAVC
jgi:hypothetical protein